MDRLTLAQDRAFKAFNEHPKPGTAGQLIAALDAYRAALEQSAQAIDRQIAEHRRDWSPWPNSYNPNNTTQMR